ncbi:MULTISPECIES: hypothetical protein [unclassified Corynebacterium]|uniref:hypothetical protein n=1 Tax=unclassified Corynebacterium TaxID=2624378 RepID=UPI001EF65126|nr:MULTISPECIES: hypothetical protein [unclassified Corynebacterium]MCG7259655.1 hypothetical protein [Corynebacterium sp. ACRQK]MCG7264046.1 hypothetical protein [Corynebacterium sp. ACRQL]
MSTERIIIHLPTAPTEPENTYNLVTAASRADKHTSAHTRQLQQHLTNILAPHKISVELTGAECIAIKDNNEHIPQLLQLISPVLSYFTTLTILENNQQVWTFGDENSRFTTETSQLHIPWASLHSIPSWIDHITTNARSLASRNIGTDPRDFLIISDNTKDQHYIQCYFSPADDNYRVEMRLGDAQHHFWCMRNDARSLIRELSTWMNSTDHPITGWNKLDIS